jgi:hypothetical protein
MDRPKRQTATATPAKPGGLPLTLGPSPHIEIRPGDLSDSLADALARAGFRQTSFQASLVGEVAETPPTDIVIRSVETSEMMERFLDV